jgi:hypothetical protein
VEGPRIDPDPDRDTVIGPVGFIGVADTYRSYARRPTRPGEAWPGLNAWPMKVLAVVRQGRRVTLTVPRGQRPWMRLFYDTHEEEDRGLYSITLAACHRHADRAAALEECGWLPFNACLGAPTQFSGGVYVDFENAPRRGRCARLAVRPGGAERPLVRRLFKPAAGSCS